MSTRRLFPSVTSLVALVFLAAALVGCSASVVREDNADFSSVREEKADLSPGRKGEPDLSLEALHGVTAEATQANLLDMSLREEIHSVPVFGAGARIIVTSFRPTGSGPFPWIVLSHGTNAPLDANRMIGRSRNLPLVREWVRRGYAVVVPVRRGYGASGGKEFSDRCVDCTVEDHRTPGEGAALDILAAVEWAKSQRDLDAKRWLLVGQSTGGFASIYAASKRPPGLVAVLAFAPGRRGRPTTHPGEPLAADLMARLFAEIAPKIEVPVLWFYASNDEYFGPRVQNLWFQSFRGAGGRGELVVVRQPFPWPQGHVVFGRHPEGVPIWSRAVSEFFASRRLSLPFVVDLD